MSALTHRASHRSPRSSLLPRPLQLLWQRGSRFALLCTLVIAALTATGCGSDDAGGPASFTLATFNVRNFFDALDDPLKLDETPTAAEAAQKLQELGTALRVLDADVVALQEVENIAVLRKLRDEELESLGYSEVHLLEGNDPRGIDVALLSRLAVTRVKTHKDDRFDGVDGDTSSHKFSRDCLEADVAVGSRTLTLLINHLRASTSGGNDDVQRRNAQAARVRAIADGILSGKSDALLAVVGDLNDDPQSRALELMAKGSPALGDVLEGLPSSQRHTVNWSGKKQVDYILTSPALGKGLKADSAAVQRTQIFSNTSDHYPVKAEFGL